MVSNSTSALIYTNPPTQTNPPTHDEPNHGTVSQGATSFGSATALVAALDPSEAKLGVANLGDSGLRRGWIFWCKSTGNSRGMN